MQYSELTRPSLIERVRHHDSQAWQLMVSLYGPLVAYWCRRNGLDAHSTADCLQEVFVALSQSMTAYVPTNRPGSFRGWLWGITQNKLRDHRRKHERQIAATGGSTAMHLMQQVVSGDDEPESSIINNRLMRSALDVVREEVEPRTWSIFERSVIDQMPTSVVASEFNIQPAAIRQIRSRILRRMRQHLGDVE
jgi:RNA polymerase sigma-70 factor (ECF subfamily)